MKKSKLLAVMTAIMLLFTAFNIGFVFAETEGKDPEPPNNGYYKVYFKFDPKYGKEQSHDGISVTFENQGDSGYKTVSWTANENIQVCYALVKAGSVNDEDSYTWYPYTTESSDTGLTASNGKDISHISFYYVYTAKLKVQKALNYKNGEPLQNDDFGFGIAIENSVAGINQACTLSNGESEEFILPLGTYTVSEEEQSTPYSFVKYTLDGTDNDGTVVFDQKGQKKTLIVYNQKENPQPVQTGQITIKKTVQKQVGGEWVAVNDDQTEFKVTVITNDNKEEIAGSPFTVSANKPYPITGLPYGTYLLEEEQENMPVGYEQYKGPDYNNSITIDANNLAAEYTFTNHLITVTPPAEKGTITIQKNLLDENNRPIVPTGLSFSIKLTDFNGRAMVYTVPVGVQYQTALLPIGAYTVEEVDIPNEYELVGIDHSTFNLTTAGFTVTVTNKVKPTQPPVENGSIRVVKTIGSAEVPQKGVEFKLHINSEDVRSLVTDENGIALFEDVPTGAYTLEEVKPAGFDTTMEVESPVLNLSADVVAADSIQVTVEAGETTTVDVTNTPLVNEGETYDPGYKICGYKFNDSNNHDIHNGVRDEGEPGLPNWTIQLWPDNVANFMALTPVNIEEATPIATTTTDANGYYEFTGLEPGYYIVREVQQTGWKPSRYAEQPVYLNGDSYSGEIKPVNLLDDVNFKKAMPNEKTDFEAEGRIGLPGERDYELALKTINPTTEIKAQKYVDGWKNFAEPQPFTLSLRHTGGYGNHTITITFTALGETIQTVLPNDYPNDIMIRTKAAEAGSGIIINNLKLDNTEGTVTNINGTSIAVNGVRDTDILWLPQLYFGDQSNFDLTGDIMMYWDGNAVPERSELAFQIAVGDAEPSQTEYVDFGNYQEGDQEEPNQPTISKTDNLASARPGDVLTYKITVDPNDYNLNGAYLLESPDPNTEYIGGDEWQLVETKEDGSKIYRHNLNAYVPTLSGLDAPYVPQVPDFKVRVKATTPRTIRLVTNNVTLYFAEAEDPVTARDTTAINHPTIDDPDDHHDHDTPIVNTGKPDLVITKTDNGSVVSPGGLVEYVITVENKGNAPAQDVKIYEVQPEGAAFVADRNQGWVLADGKYVYSLGTLNVGDKKEAKFILRVNDPFPAGMEKILNNVEVKDNGTETATTDNKASDDTPILIAKTVVAEPPVTLPPTPTPEPTVNDETQVPDLPFTGGVAEVELLFAGMGALLMGAGLVLKRK